MTEDLKPVDMELQCEGITLRGRRCRKPAVANYGGADYCGTHYQRTKEALEPALEERVRRLERRVNLV